MGEHCPTTVYTIILRQTTIKCNYGLDPNRNVPDDRLPLRRLHHSNTIFRAGVCLHQAISQLYFGDRLRAWHIPPNLQHRGKASRVKGGAEEVSEAFYG